MHRTPPNILWLLTDEQRTDSLGCYGSPWAHTPNLDRLAHEGVLFQRATTPAPVCVPARVSLMTGEYPSRTGVWYNRVHGTHLPHLTLPFQRAGYRTASFGKQHYCSSNPAFETEWHIECSEAVSWYGYADRFDMSAYDVIQYPDEPYRWIFGGRFPEDAEKTSEARVIRRAQQWLEETADSRPFFLRVSFNGPHTPVVPPEPFDRLISPEHIIFPPEVERRPEGMPEWVVRSLLPFADASRLTPEQIRRMRAYYYGEVAFLDALFGELLDWMRARGMLEDTVIVFTSDHGTHLGDYGLVQKQTFYEPVVRVPFFFWHPHGIAQGACIRTPVETRWLLPTLMELVGLAPPAHLKGCSLAQSLVRGEEPPQRPIFSEFTLGSFRVRHTDRLVMVRDGRWKLALCVDPHPHDGALYDLERDPMETKNLYGHEEVRAVQARLTRLVERHLKGGMPPTPP